MPWKYGGKIIRVGRPWTNFEGIKHPFNWIEWSDSEKAKQGLVWENDPEPFDNRFYWGRDKDGELIPRDLNDVNATDDDGNAIRDEDGNQVVIEGLKTKHKNLTKVAAGGLLQPTDWKVIKASEVSDYTVDSTTLTYRAAVRTASNTIETKIDNASDLTAFVALFDRPVDKDGNPTGNPPIYDWPDEI